MIYPLFFFSYFFFEKMRISDSFDFKSTLETKKSFFVIHELKIKLNK